MTYVIRLRMWGNHVLALALQASRKNNLSIVRRRRPAISTESSKSTCVAQGGGVTQSKRSYCIANVLARPVACFTGHRDSDPSEAFTTKLLSNQERSCLPRYILVGIGEVSFSTTLSHLCALSKVAGPHRSYNSTCTLYTDGSLTRSRLAIR